MAGLSFEGQIGERQTQKEGRAFQAEGAACTKAQREGRERARLISGAQGPQNGWSERCGWTVGRQEAQERGAARGRKGRSSRELGFHPVGHEETSGEGREVVKSG